MLHGALHISVGEDIRVEPARDVDGGVPRELLHYEEFSTPALEEGEHVALEDDDQGHDGVICDEAEVHGVGIFWR